MLSELVDGLNQLKMDDINAYISNNTDTKILLLRIPEVIKWIFGDISFITTDNKKSNYKTLEDN